MFRVDVNSEHTKQVILDFSNMIDSNEECIEDCIEVIYSLTEKFKDIDNNCIDEPQDYHYLIECSDEKEAEEIEEYLSTAFEEIEDTYFTN